MQKGYKHSTKKADFVKRTLQLFLILIYSAQANAQFTDDFSDGDFTQNPPWAGQSANFQINADQRLQLNAAGEGVSWLTTPSGIIRPAEWRFWIKLAFSPSGNNFSRVYLISDQNDLSGPLNGYYLQFGEAGSADAIQLFRQQGTTHTSICRGTEGFISASFAIGMKIINQENGNWEVFADAAGGNNYQLQATGNDQAITEGNCFGVYCKYTSSNAGKMYYDDFYAGPIAVDLTPPEWLSLEITSDSSLQLVFSEALDPAPATNPANYSVDQGAGMPQGVSQPSADKVNLSFAAPFAQGINYTLSISGLKDLAGNETGTLSRNFSIYNPQPFDVVINEIMADPDPPVGLPNWEYIELHNTTGVNISLHNWVLRTGSTQKTLTNAEIPPRGYLILCRPEARAELNAYGTTAPVTSLTLTNTGQELKLIDPNGKIISRVKYSDKWYGDAAKANGGWSLEQKDPLAFCLGAENWLASKHPSGGTPGSQNSVLDSLSLLPLVKLVAVVPPNSLKVVFNQGMDSTSLANTAHYTVSPGNAKPVEALVADESLTTVMLAFEQNFEQGTEYRLILSQGIQNCQGVPLPENTFWYFRLPAPARPFDILITEIMADPEPSVGLPAHEYVEIFNRSGDLVDLSGWTFTSGTSKKTIATAYLGPGEFLILGHEKAEADLSGFGHFYGFSSFSLTNTGQSLSLANPAGTVISWVDYSDTWYGASPKKNGGWSLEMVDDGNPCTGEGNWLPSVDESGGTPGRDNSVKGSNPDTIAPRLVSVYPRSASEIELYFSESIDSVTATQASYYQIDNGIGNPLQSEPINYRNMGFLLRLPDPLAEGRLYTLATTSAMGDCAGNLLAAGAAVQFGLPAAPSPSEIVINELLTNPYEGGSDYLELMNRSEKIIDLGAMGITYQSLTSQGSPKTIFLPSLLMLPRKYYCLTRKPPAVIAHYGTPNPDQVIATDNLPDFTSDSGIIILHRRENTAIEVDRLKYTSKMHLAMLKDLDGVALERINPARSPADPTNWTSASEASGFGTPAAQNSQYAEVPASKGTMTISPEIFSPDADGADDLAHIRITPPAEGYMANLGIYDARGRLVRRLARNFSTGTEATLSWDGARDDRTKAPAGIYVILCELFDLSGNSETHKATLVLALTFQ